MNFFACLRIILANNFAKPDLENNLSRKNVNLLIGPLEMSLKSLVMVSFSSASVNSKKMINILVKYTFIYFL